MRIVAIVALILALAASAWASPNLMLAVSKRIPTLGDTVRIAAYWDGWLAETPDAAVLIYAELEGQEHLVGRTRIAKNPQRPFEPCVEWKPDQDGPWRVIARSDPSPGPATALRVPVTVQPAYFCWYGDTRPEVEWMTHHLTAAEAEIPALHARGAMALKNVGGVSYFGGPRPEDIRPDIDFAAIAPRIVADYTNVEPWDGISIDELGMWDQEPDQTRLALGFWDVLKQVRAVRPNGFIAAWQFASLTPLECNMFRNTTDLIMCEVYQNHFRAWYDQHALYDYLRQRIDMARQMMVIKQTIIGLSISTTYGGTRPDELEDQIRFIRANGPEIPGLAFFTTSDCDPKVLKAANDCCYRYWVRPAVALFSEADLTLSESAPQQGGTIDVLATVHNVGGSAARSVAVRFWDGDPAKGGKPIARKVIPHLPAARWVDPKARDAASVEPAEKMRSEGFGMVTVSVPWTATAGPHELWAEIVPSSRYTTIRGYESRRFTVQ